MAGGRETPDCWGALRRAVEHMDTGQTAARCDTRQARSDRPRRAALARRRRREQGESLPLDPRDPDIVRAKELRRGGPGE
jgi:hypothetical protein